MGTKSQNLKQMAGINKIIILTVLLNLYFISGAAQPQSLSQTATVPLDESIRYGRLPNGLTYFIKSIPGPQSKLFLRLYNRAGGNQEENNQLNFAHAVEHLTFKATDNFPSGIENSHRIEELGLGMYDYTAISGHRATEYMFDAPQGNTEALNLGLLWFRDIMSGLKFTEKDINQVRGELRQEFIMANGDDLSSRYANGHLNSLLFPCSKDYTNFLEHNESFDPENLRRFYKDWYRPDLMAVSIVGNIDDLDVLEKRIRKNFSKITSPKEPRELEECDAAYLERPPQYFVVERPLDPSKFLPNKTVEIKLFYRDKLTIENLSAEEGLKRMKLMELVVDVVNERLQMATNEYNSFTVGSAYLFNLKGLPPALGIEMQLEGAYDESIEKTIHVIRQIQKYGISKGEWEKIKKQQLQFLESANSNKPSYWIHEIERYFTHGEALPPNKQAVLRNWLTNLNKEEFNGFIKKFLEKAPEDIGIIAPADHEALSFTESEVRSWVEDAIKGPVEPYELPRAPSGLLSTEEIERLHEKGYVDNGTGETGARELVLDNGVKVVLKSYGLNSGGQARINLHGFSLKGADCFPKENYFPAINSAVIVRNAGVNGMNRFEIDQFLSSTSLRPGGVASYVGSRETGILADAELRDTETMLQLVFLHFTRPNRDELAFEDWKDREYKAYQNPTYNLIDMDFKNAIKTFMGESGERRFFGRKLLRGTKRFEGVEQTEFGAAYDAYEKLFGNSRDFTFVISGQFDFDTVIPLIQKYLGNLPNTSSFLSCVPLTKEKELPKGPLFVEIPSPEYYGMKNVSYGIRFFKKAEGAKDWKEQLIVEALGDITNKKVWDLRFGKGYSLYNVGVAGKFNKDMNRYEISSDFECLPEEFPLIREEFHQIISEIKSGMISEEEFRLSLQRMHSIYEAKRASNPKVMFEKLFHYYRYEQPWIDPEDLENYVKSLTVEDIVEVANKYYKDEKLYEFVMRDKDF